MLSKIASHCCFFCDDDDNDDVEDDDVVSRVTMSRLHCPLSIVIDVMHVTAITRPATGNTDHAELLRFR